MAYMGEMIELATGGIMGVLLAIVCWTDWKTMRIPDCLIKLFLIPAALSMAMAPQMILADRVLGMLCTSTPMYLLTCLIPGSFGGGDIKLVAVCGLILGWKGSLLALWIAIMAGGSGALILMALGRLKPGMHMAFGPYLALGIWLTYLYEEAILRWYLHA